MKTYLLKGCMVAITGGAGGLGLVLAKALRAKGARIALLDLDGAVVSKKARELGGADVAAGWQADVCSLDSVEIAMASVVPHFGGIDGVIADAGIHSTVGCHQLRPRKTQYRVLDELIATLLLVRQGRGPLA